MSIENFFPSAARSTLAAAPLFYNTVTSLAFGPSKRIQRLILATFLAFLLLASCSDSAFASRFFGPEGLAFDASGNLWVANSQNNTVIEISPQNNSNAPMKVISSPGGPSRLAFDSNGNLYVANTSANTVIKFNTVTMSSIKTYGAQTGFTFNRPLGLAIDVSNNLYVANNGSNKVSVITPGNVQQDYNLAQNGVTATAPGALEFLRDPTGTDGTLWVGFGPSVGPSQIYQYSSFKDGVQPLQPANATERTYTGPTGITFLGSDKAVSYLYSGNAVYYGGFSGTVPLGGAAAPNQTGWCEGIAAIKNSNCPNNSVNGKVYVANSSPLNSITVYNVSCGMPNPTPLFTLR
jgi:hypothetical protein